MGADRVQRVQSEDAEKLRSDVEGAINDAATRLRSIESVAQQLLRTTTTERQHLDVFLDDLQYRLHAVNTSGDLRMTSTGPLTEDQISAMHGQQEVLSHRKVELGVLSDELEQLSSRISWLIHQIEGARQWVLASADAVFAKRSHNNPAGVSCCACGRNASDVRSRESGPAMAVASLTG